MENDSDRARLLPDSTLISVIDEHLGDLLQFIIRFLGPGRADLGSSPAFAGKLSQLRATISRLSGIMQDAMVYGFDPTLIAPAVAEAKDLSWQFELESFENVGTLASRVAGLHVCMSLQQVIRETSLLGLRSMQGAPATDRIVTLGDNQRVEFAQNTKEVIEAVRSENAIDGDPTLRNRILGQLEAGRDLLEAGTFRLCLLHATLMSALYELAAKYMDRGLGIAVGKLIEMLVEAVFK